MRDIVRLRPARGLAVLVCVGAALALSACVSNSSGNAFGPPATPTVAPVPTVAPTATVPPISLTQPAAIVDGTPIAGADYARALAQERTATSFQLQQSPGSAPPTEQQLRTFTLNHLIERRIEALYARDHGITVTAAAVQAQYQALQLRFGGPITFTNTLKNYGFTPATFMSELRGTIWQSKIQKIVVPLPTSIEEVQARHILVKTRALADKLYAELVRTPTQFAALARKYSIDTGSAPSGGELGSFPRGQMVPPFEHAAFTQPIGQIGRPVRSQFGYHIIQVEAHKAVPFTSLDAQTQQAYQQRQQTTYQRWVNKERTYYHVSVVAPTLLRTG